MKGENLLPCPFCGDKDIQVDRIGTNRASCQVSCMNCGASLESNEIGYGHDWNIRSDETASLRSEIASLSPKLVLPSDEDKQNAYLNMYPEMEESDGFDDGFIEAWEAYESELRRLNPSLFK